MRKKLVGDLLSLDTFVPAPFENKRMIMCFINSNNKLRKNNKKQTDTQKRIEEKQLRIRMKKMKKYRFDISMYKLLLVVVNRFDFEVNQI